MYNYVFRNRFNTSEYLTICGESLEEAVKAYLEEPDVIPIEAFDLMEVLAEDDDAWDVDGILGDPWDESC